MSHYRLVWFLDEGFERVRTILPKKEQTDRCGSQHPTYVSIYSIALLWSNQLVAFLHVLPRIGGRFNRSGKSTCLTKEQIKIFCLNLPIKYSLLAELMYFSVGHVKEITTIKVHNLSFNKATITIQKTSTEIWNQRWSPAIQESWMGWNHG